MVLEKSYRSLHEFVKLFWNVVEPKAFVDGWHIRAICDHLEAVSDGRIKHLLINMPPRHCKSLIVSVFWPAWEWLHNPSKRYLHSSYAQSLSVRDSVKCRRIIQSPLYQEMMALYQDNFELTSDQNTKLRFDNSFGGYRLATSVDGSNTGEGGDILVIDDPHNVQEGESVAEREGTIKWWDEVMSTRGNDKQAAWVIVMQRVHQSDLSGHEMAKNDPDLVVLCLPARFEGEHRSKTPLDFVDPRWDIGDPLWPEMYGDVELTRLEKALGMYGAACQLQQRPSPRKGGMFPVENFRIVNTLNPLDVKRSCRYWDTAGTQDGGCYTVGMKQYLLKDGRTVIDISGLVRKQMGEFERDQCMKMTADRDGKRVPVWIEVQGGSSGKEIAQKQARMLRGYTVRLDKPSGTDGNKVVRAKSYASQVQAGNVLLLVVNPDVDGDKLNAFLQEHEMFPNSTYKDQVDSAAGGFNRLDDAGVQGVWGSEYN